MELLDVLYSRRSVRDYAAKRVGKKTILTLLDAAVQAPSAMNSQPWAFAVIQDKAELKKISDIAKKALLAGMKKSAPMNKYREMLEDPDFNIFYNASTLVLILAKPEGPCPAEDCRQAAQNFMLAAREMGLGTCFIGFATHYLNTAEAKAKYGIPAEYKVAAPLIIGTPKEPFGKKPKNPPEILFWK